MCVCVSTSFRPLPARVVSVFGSIIPNPVPFRFPRRLRARALFLCRVVRCANPRPPPRISTV